MSSYQTTVFSTNKKYGSPIVGGNVSDKKYIDTQSRIINDQNQKSITNENLNVNSNISPNNYLPYGSQNMYGVSTYEPQIHKRPEKTDEYNPLLYFLSTKHIDPNIKNKIKRDIFYLNIDSSARTTIPSFTTKFIKNLLSDPLRFTTIVKNNQNVGVLVITHQNHNLQINDRITLTGLEQNSVTISSFVIDTNSQIVYGIEFTNGDEFVKFNVNPNMSSSSNVLNSTIANYDQSDITVTISGFIGDPTTASVGNIPINYLNSTHQIYLIKPSTTIPIGNYNFSSFYIKLNTKFQGSLGNTPYNVTLTFNHIGGIPLNKINAEYPLSPERLSPYQLVNSVINKDSYTILMPKIPYYYGQFGGSAIYIGGINSINTGYPNPNNYTITLGDTVYNAISVRMINSIIPNSGQVFRSSSVFTNNKLYWKNQDDGDVIYSISIPPGNYTPDLLKQTLETSISTVKRQLNLNQISSNTTYSLYNIMQITIDLPTNIVTFYSYKSANVIKPIIKVTPDILTDGSDPGTDTFILNISQTKHGLSTGDIVLFNGFISHLGISDTALNTEHIVYNVLDADTYQIQLTHINLFTSGRTSTGGGYATQINIPNQFQLLFTYQDTMGSLLGFRNAGSETSITPFGKSISNSMAYMNEITTDTLGNPIDITNNAVILSGDNYILMTCEQLSKITHVGSVQIDNVFAKINLSGLPGKLLYDTYVSTPHIYENPIDIKTLTFKFYSPTGELYDFNGLDHSFVLEIVTLNELPEETENNSNTLRDIVG